ncbi:MAG: hypothetical protein RMY34_23855 [Aulosira sp. DedQUE10]|nr:hypothetical protein [Aulosira sp. DedQUE10]
MLLSTSCCRCPVGASAAASFEEVTELEEEFFVPQVQDKSQGIHINSDELNLLHSEDLSLTSGVNNSDNSLVSSNIIQL